MLLTKSKFQTGLKCPRCFWKAMHEKTTDEISVQEEQNINQGIQVDYYNPSQNGSCSIKKVLPAVTGKSYEGMEIANGGDASFLYFRATFEDGFSVKEKEEVYSNLLKYCKLDTEGMVWIIDELKKLVINY